MNVVSSPLQEEIVIAIPCYNSQDTLGRTLENTLEQTYRDFRVIVYDDGSTDASPDIVRSFEKRDSRIALYRNDLNQGRPQARNALLNLAPEAILAWQDADDLWHPAKLACQVAYYGEVRRECTDGKIALVSSLERRRPNDENGDDPYLSRVLDQGYYGTLHPPHLYDIDFICSRKYMSFPFYLQSTFARASHFIEAGGFDDQLPWYEDLDMGIKLLGIGTRIFGLQNDVALAYYYSGAPRLAPDVITACLNKIYSNNMDYLSKAGIDIRYDLTLRKLTLLFLGMIRKKEFPCAFGILAEDSTFALRHPELRGLITANLDLLQRALQLDAGETLPGVAAQFPLAS